MRQAEVSSSAGLQCHLFLHSKNMTFKFLISLKLQVMYSNKVDVLTGTNKITKVYTIISTNV